MIKIKKFVSYLTIISFILSELTFPSVGWSAPTIVSGAAQNNPDLSLNIPAEFGTLETQVSGDGPTIIHIQTAHGNYEAQKNIQSLLQYFKKNHDIKLLFLEGSSAELDSDRLRFFPERMDITMQVADDLAKEALVTGAELYLLEETDVKAYGVENREIYLENGRSFLEVLKQQEKTKEFLKNFDLQIERLASAYLSPNMRAYLKQLERYEAGTFPLMDWLAFLRSKAEEVLAVDFKNPETQLDWPMLFRIFKLQKFEAQMDLKKFEKERKKFLKTIRKIPNKLYQKIETLLSSPLTEQYLPAPQTGLLFENMVRALPEAFRYEDYPQVTSFIGYLILQSEIDSEKLMEEMNQLSERVAGELALNDKEKVMVRLLEDYRLLKRLFALELTPEDYEKIVGADLSVRPVEKITTYLNDNLESGATHGSAPTDMRPSVLIQRFIQINEDNRVKNIEFQQIEEMNILFERALDFYRGAKERDKFMLQNIERLLSDSSLRAKRGNLTPKAVVITGGFHSEPFMEHFSQAGYNYALVSPKITTFEGHEAYIKSVFTKESHLLKKSTREGQLIAGRDSSMTPELFNVVASLSQTRLQQAKLPFNSQAFKNRIANTSAYNSRSETRQGPIGFTTAGDRNTGFELTYMGESLKKIEDVFHWGEQEWEYSIKTELLVESLREALSLLKLNESAYYQFSVQPLVGEKSLALKLVAEPTGASPRAEYYVRSHPDSIPQSFSMALNFALVLADRSDGVGELNIGTLHSFMESVLPAMPILSERPSWKELLQSDTELRATINVKIDINREKAYEQIEDLTWLFRKAFPNYDVTLKKLRGKSPSANARVSFAFSFSAASKTKMTVEQAKSYVKPIGVKTEDGKVTYAVNDAEATFSLTKALEAIHVLEVTDEPFARVQVNGAEKVGAILSRVKVGEGDSIQVTIQRSETRAAPLESETTLSIGEYVRFQYTSPFQVSTKTTYGYRAFILEDGKIYEFNVLTQEKGSEFQTNENFNIQYLGEGVISATNVGEEQKAGALRVSTPVNVRLAPSLESIIRDRARTPSVGEILYSDYTGDDEWKAPAEKVLREAFNAIARTPAEALEELNIEASFGRGMLQAYARALGKRFVTGDEIKNRLQGILSFVQAMLKLNGSSTDVNFHLDGELSGQPAEIPERFPAFFSILLRPFQEPKRINIGLRDWRVLLAAQNVSVDHQSVYGRNIGERLNLEGGDVIQLNKDFLIKAILFSILNKGMITPWIIADKYPQIDLSADRQALRNSKTGEVIIPTVLDMFSLVKVLAALSRSETRKSPAKKWEGIDWELTREQVNRVQSDRVNTSIEAIKREFLKTYKEGGEEGEALLKKWNRVPWVTVEDIVEGVVENVGDELRRHFDYLKGSLNDGDAWQPTDLTQGTFFIDRFEVNQKGHVKTIKVPILDVFKPGREAKELLRKIIKSRIEVGRKKAEFSDRQKVDLRTARRIENKINAILEQLQPNSQEPMTWPYQSGLSLVIGNVGSYIDEGYTRAFHSFSNKKLVLNYHIHFDKLVLYKNSENNGVRAWLLRDFPRFIASIRTRVSSEKLEAQFQNWPEWVALVDELTEPFRRSETRAHQFILDVDEIKGGVFSWDGSIDAEFSSQFAPWHKKDYGLLISAKKGGEYQEHVLLLRTDRTDPESEFAYNTYGAALVFNQANLTEPFVDILDYGASAEKLLDRGWIKVKDRWKKRPKEVEGHTFWDLQTLDLGVRASDEVDQIDFRQVPYETINRQTISIETLMKEKGRGILFDQKGLKQIDSALVPTQSETRSPVGVEFEENQKGWSPFTITYVAGDARHNFDDVLYFAENNLDHKVAVDKLIRYLREVTFLLLDLTESPYYSFSVEPVKEEERQHYSIKFVAEPKGAYPRVEYYVDSYPGSVPYGVAMGLNFLLALANQSDGMGEFNIAILHNLMLAVLPSMPLLNAESPLQSLTDSGGIGSVYVGNDVGVTALLEQAQALAWIFQKIYPNYQVTLSDLRDPITKGGLRHFDFKFEGPFEPPMSVIEAKSYVSPVYVAGEDGTIAYNVVYDGEGSIALSKAIAAIRVLEGTMEPSTVVRVNGKDIATSVISRTRVDEGDQIQLKIPRSETRVNMFQEDVVGELMMTLRDRESSGIHIKVEDVSDELRLRAVKELQSRFDRALLDYELRNATVNRLDFPQDKPNVTDLEGIALIKLKHIDSHRQNEIFKLRAAINMAIHRFEKALGIDPDDESFRVWSKSRGTLTYRLTEGHIETRRDKLNKRLKKRLKAKRKIQRKYDHLAAFFSDPEDRPAEEKARNKISKLNSDIQDIKSLLALLEQAPSSETREVGVVDVEPKTFNGPREKTYPYHLQIRSEVRVVAQALEGLGVSVKGYDLPQQARLTEAGIASLGVLAEIYPMNAATSLREQIDYRHVFSNDVRNYIAPMMRAAADPNLNYRIWVNASQAQVDDLNRALRKYARESGRVEGYPEANFSIEVAPKDVQGAIFSRVKKSQVPIGVVSSDLSLIPRVNATPGLVWAKGSEDSAVHDITAALLDQRALQSLSRETLDPQIYSGFELAEGRLEIYLQAYRAVSSAA